MELCNHNWKWNPSFSFLLLFLFLLLIWFFYFTFLLLAYYLFLLISYFYLHLFWRRVDVLTWLVNLRRSWKSRCSACSDTHYNFIIAIVVMSWLWVNWKVLFDSAEIYAIHVIGANHFCVKVKLAISYTHVVPGNFIAYGGQTQRSNVTFSDEYFYRLYNFSWHLPVLQNFYFFGTVNINFI